MEQKKQPLKKRIFDIIQIGQRGDLPSRLFDYFIVAVIFINITVMFMETFAVFAPYLGALRVVEAVTMVIFLLEYVLRIWTSAYLYPEKNRKQAALSFVISMEGIVDFLTILPFFFLTGFVVFRMLRVVRIFHLFRINASYDSFHVITSVIYEKRNQIISSVFIIIILMMSSSLCMYSAEHEAQPEVFNNAFSGMWWSISTILTVGYGDIYPITTLGRAMAILIALFGVGVVAIPTGIISAGFVEQYTDFQKNAVLLSGVDGVVRQGLTDTLHIWDISKGVFETQAYPGDPVASAKDWFSIEKSDVCNLHELTLGTHTGTHIDAPRHFLKNGATVDEIPLSKLIGPCKVADIKGQPAGGTIDLTEQVLKDLLPEGEKKLLVKGNAVLTVEGALYLADQGVELYGTELSTVGNSQTGPEIHRILLHAGIVILENLSMEDVEEGAYQLFAQPLKLTGMDGSPVRAVLTR